MRRILTCIFLFFICAANAQSKRNYTTTPTYDNVITTFKSLSGNPYSKLIEYGTTDVGKPLHLFILSKDKIFDPVKIKESNKSILFINNGIHPGEPDGIDASIELIRSFLSEPSIIPDNVVICIVPVFNVDGALNRGKYSRANQNGPEEYGFRGNARNLDLNRDFIKCDSKNTQTLIQIMEEWDPDVFIDNHVSNGADYQYVITLINTQKDKLHPQLSSYMSKQMLPYLYSDMKKKKIDLIPYVDPINETPDNGIADFLETPRFSTGYTTQMNRIGFVTETHMWKPYNERVWATYELMHTLIKCMNNDYQKIINSRKSAIEATKLQTSFYLNWEQDTTKFETIQFKGYEAGKKTSKVTGKERLYYDRSAPYTKTIKHYNTYKGIDAITAPSIYIVPQAWGEVLNKLKMNGVIMKQLSKDTLVECSSYYIVDYKTVSRPYEGHYLHYNITTKTVAQKINFYEGDYIIDINQSKKRFIVETLEPVCNDSYFAWGFFDAVLQQKEYFSDYIFDDTAFDLLQKDSELKSKFESKKKTDAGFADNHLAQLNFIYQNSYYKEKTHNRYPVYFLTEWIQLPYK